VDSIDELGHHVATELAGWRRFGLIGARNWRAGSAGGYGCGCGGQQQAEPLIEMH